MKNWFATLAVLMAAAAFRASAQDTTGAIMLGVRGASRAQPGLAVLSGPGIDSVRLIVQRDLDFSNRFTVAHLADSAGRLRGPLDPKVIQGTGLSYVVELEPAPGGVLLKLWDATTGTLRQQVTRAADVSGVGDGRLSVHQLSDQVVNWIGGIGIAATRIAFKGGEGQHQPIYRIDSDGANLVRISRPDVLAITPTWSPDGSAIAYGELKDGRWNLWVQKLATGSMAQVTDPIPGDSYGPAFAPDGKSLLFTHTTERGADIAVTQLSPMCCVNQLTRDGRLALNVAPSFSPDARRITFASTRTGTSQIDVMDADGTGRSQLVPTEFDGTKALDAYAPTWSPDGARVAYARETAGGSRQLFTMLLGSSQVVQLSSAGSNEDPSWAPDSRHLVVKSRRSGKEQLWIYDLESGVWRQLTTVSGGARFPAWSRSLGAN